jgi:addiction module HigA family antidote
MAKREFKATARGLPPAHPGELLRDDVLPAAGLTVGEAAEALGVSRQTLHAILSGRQAVTAAMALRLGCLFGNGPELWAGMQQAYDLWRERERLAGELAEIRTVRVA